MAFAKRPKVFVDTSVLIAALLSTSGGSFRILGDHRYDFYINDYVLYEARDVIARKLATRTTESALFAYIGSIPLTILKNPSRTTLTKYEKYVELTDTPILATAHIHTQILLTLDKGILAAQGIVSKIRICTPGELLVG